VNFQDAAMYKDKRFEAQDPKQQGASGLDAVSSVNPLNPLPPAATMPGRQPS